MNRGNYGYFKVPNKCNGSNKYTGYPGWLRRYSGETELVNGILLVLVKAKVLFLALTRVKALENYTCLLICEKMLLGGITCVN